MNRPRGRKVLRHVGLKANLRKSAVFLSDRRSPLPGRLNVCESLVLADDLLCYRDVVSGGGIGGTSQAS